MTEEKPVPFWGRPQAYAAAVLLSAALLVAVALYRTATREWSPIADNAVIWMRSWDVGTRHTPLFGPHSRLGFHHPGPMMYFLLAAPLRLFRGAPSALLATALVVSLASTIAAVLLVKRYAGSGPALVVAAALALLSIGHGDRLIDPWNPFLIVLPFALFLVAVWLAAGGHGVGAPIAAAAGSLAMQSHLGAVPTVVLVGGAALALRVARPPSAAPRWPSRKYVAWTVGVLFVLLSPPIVEQLVAAKGNVSAILGYFSSSKSDPRIGWKQALGMTGTELLPWGPWIGRENNGLLGDILAAPAWALPLELVPLAGALALAVRSRDDLSQRLVVVVAAGVVACLVSFAQIRGVAFYYLMLWSRPIAMLAVVAPAIVLARKYAPASGASLSSGVVNAVGAAAVAVPSAVCALLADVPTGYWSRVHSEIVPYALAALPPQSTWRVVAIGPVYTGSAETLYIALKRSGRVARMMPWYAHAVGEHRTVAATARLPTLVLATGVGVERVPHKESALVLYVRDNLAGELRATAIKLRIQLEGELIAAGRRDLVEQLEVSQPWLWTAVPPSVDRQALQRYLELTIGTLNMPIGLFMLPPTDW